MSQSVRHDSGAARPFPATQWSLVGRAGHQNTDLRRQALSTLLHRYVPALRTYLSLDRGMSCEEAEDLLQDFIADKIIEQNMLASAQVERGKFRTFLLATLKRYAISRHRAQTAAKRTPTGGVQDLGGIADHLDDGSAEDPSHRFVIAWARETIAEALRRMRSECDGSRRADLWRVFDARVVAPTLEGAEVVSYAVLVSELQLETPLQACSLLTTAKRMFERNLRAVAAEYSGDDDDAIDAEMADLREILFSGSGGGAQYARGVRK
jgi:DNA-directed RNA polymerase specialized sigma24 family protein